MPSCIFLRGTPPPAGVPNLFTDDCTTGLVASPFLQLFYGLRSVHCHSTLSHATLGCLTSRRNLSPPDTCKISCTFYHLAREHHGGHGTVYEPESSDASSGKNPPRFETKNGLLMNHQSNSLLPFSYKIPICRGVRKAREGWRHSFGHTKVGGSIPRTR